MVEIGIGIIITSVVYGRSRKSEDELRKITAKTNTLAQMQASAGLHMERAADRHLKDVLDEIVNAADEVAKSKREYDRRAGAKPRYSKEIESRCTYLANAAKRLTDPPQSVYWAASLYKLKELSGICEQGPTYIDGDIDVSFCEVVKAKARGRLEEMRGSPEPSSGMQNAADSRTDSISVSLDRAAYPPRSTIYARSRISPSLRGKRIRYEILDRVGEVLDARDLDPDDYLGSDLAQGIPEVSFKMGSSWPADGAYTVKARCGLPSAEAEFRIEQSAPSIESDKDVYVVGSDMVITVTDHDANMDGNTVEYAGDRRGSKLVVESRHGRLSGHRLQETGRATEKFQGVVKIKARKDGYAAVASRCLMRVMPGVFAVFARAPGKRKDQAGRVECGRGEEITLRYENDVDTAVRTVRTSDAGAALNLDREAYTCTGRVRITVTAPGYAGLELGAPAKKHCKASVKTSIGSLADYKLGEREPGSGVFEGSVRLTGFPALAHKMPPILQFGATGGEGPNDGVLACTIDDEVEVTADVGGNLCKAAPTRWNQGIVEFLAPSYAIGDSAAIQLKDQDMSLDPDAEDSVNIRVTSDSDRDGIEIAVKETAPASGVFYGTVALDYKRSSQKDAALLVSNGDAIYAMYTDITPPSPSETWVTYSTALISADRKVPPPLERMEIASISVEGHKTGRDELVAGESALIRVAVRAKNPYAFTVFLQIKDSHGLGPYPLWHPGRINPQQTFECGFRWTPPRPGQFTLTVYLWGGLENMTAFCPPKEHSIVVGAASGAQ